MKRKSASFVVLFTLFFSFAAFAGEVGVPNQNIKPKLLEEFKVYAGDILMRFTSVFTVDSVLTSFEQFEKSDAYDSCVNGKWFQSEGARMEDCKNSIKELNNIFNTQARSKVYWHTELSASSSQMDTFLNTVLDPKLRNFAKYQQDVLERSYERVFGLLNKYNEKKANALFEKFKANGGHSAAFKIYVEDYRQFISSDFLNQVNMVRRFVGGQVMKGLDAIQDYPNSTVKKDPKVVRVCGLNGSLIQRFSHCLHRLDMDLATFISSIRAKEYPFAEKRYHWFLVGQDYDGNQFWRDSATGLVWMTAKKKMSFSAAQTHCRIQTAGFGFAESQMVFDLPTRDQFEDANSRGMTQLFSLAKKEQWAKPDPKSMLAMEWAWSFEGGEKSSAAVVGGDDLETPRYVRCVGQPFRQK